MEENQGQENSGGLPSYPKLYALGHRAIRDIFLDDVVIEEKIDGSQLSFGVIGGELRVRSKGRQIDLDYPDSLFLEGVEYLKSIKHKIRPEYIYWGEYLKKPRHNVLAYSRIPANHIIGFDIVYGPEMYMLHEKKIAYFNELGLETVPLLYEGRVANYENFHEFLDRVSCLGGQKIEGVVVKKYNRFGPDGRALMGKFVSEAFKEVARNTWVDKGGSNKGLIEKLISRYTTEARWNKAVQHLRELGLITDTPADIGPIMKEVHKDIIEECGDEIKEELFSWAWKFIARGITRGLPQWYKEKVMIDLFKGENGGNTEGS